MPDLPDALCKNENPTLWFGPHVCDVACDGVRGCIVGKSEQGRFARIREARDMCSRCPEQERCLDWALENDQSFGIWGGTTERERKQMRRSQRA